jgi:hypothetical protein
MDMENALAQAAIRLARILIGRSIRAALGPRGLAHVLVAERRAAEQLPRDHHAGFVVVEGIPDVAVQAGQGAIVPPLQHVAPTGFLQQTAQFSHGRLRRGSRILVPVSIFSISGASRSSVAIISPAQAGIPRA